MPVRRGIIKTHTHASLATCRHIFPHKITATHEILRVEITKIARPKRESLVVARGQHGISKASLLSRLEPFFGMVIGWIEFFREREVIVGLELVRVVGTLVPRSVKHHTP